jgi:hypothetical protein
MDAKLICKGKETTQMQDGKGITCVTYLHHANLTYLDLPHLSLEAVSHD